MPRVNIAIKTRLCLILCAAALALSGCGKKTEAPSSALKSDDGILAYVPADTPYVFAGVTPLPDDVADKLESQNDVVLKMYGEAMMGFVEASAADGEMDDSTRAIIEEIAGLMSIEKLREAGIGRDAQGALYGVGLVPVIRFSLTEGKAFEDTIARIEEKAGQKMTVATAGGQSYRYAGDDEARILLAVIDDYAVISFVPSALPESAVAAVLGVDRPDKNIAATGALADLAANYDFTAHGLGFVDIQRVTSTFVEPASGVNAELLSMMDYDAASVSPTCRTEALEMAATAPRLVAGYTEISVDELKSNTALELRSDLAKGLSALAAPVPGLGADHGGLFSFGMSLDIQAARDFYESRLDAVAADPYECEWFAEFQAGLEQGRQALNQPLPPIAYSIKGFVAVVDTAEGLDFATQPPPTDIDARLLVATENGPGIIAMGAMFSPELMALDMKADGKPVEVPLPPNPANFQSAFLALTDASLALALGDDASSRLSALLDTPVADPPPFMSVNMDAARYYRLMGETMTMDLPQADDDPMHGAPPVEMMASMSQMMTELGDIMERMQVDMIFTERGIEMPSTVTLAD